MSRSGAAAALPVGSRVVLAVLALLAAALLGACERPPEVATHRVESQRFVHRVRAEGHLAPTRATSISVPTQVRQAVRIAWRAEDGARLETGDVVIRFDPLEMERELEKGRADLEQSRLEGEKAVASNAERSHGVARQRAEAELQLEVSERFEKSDDVIYSRHEIIESQIDTELAAQRKRQAAELEEIHRDLSQAESELLEIDTRRARQRIDQARTGLEELEVRAPHSGLLTWNRDWQGEIPEVGEQVWGGQPLAQIPSLERMKAEVFVLEADAGGLATGQSALVRVEAHPDSAIPAVVTRVDAVAKAPYRGTPLQYFGVELELAPEAAGDQRLRPGQRLTATLILEDVADALVVPRQALMTDRDAPYVWLRQGPRFVAREVTVGPRSAAQVVVTRGLEPGDVVALEPIDAPAEREPPSERDEPDEPAPAATGA